MSYRGTGLSRCFIILIIIVMIMENEMGTFARDAQKQKLKLYIRHRGRLGNTMFQIASVYGLAVRSGRHPVIMAHPKINLTSIFPNMSDYLTILEGKEFTKQVNSKKTTVINLADEARKVEFSVKKDFKGLLEFLNEYRENVEILCCQPEKYMYFEHSHKEIQHMFSFDGPTMARSRAFLGLLSSRVAECGDSCTFIGIHVRRGDYVDGIWHTQYGWNSPFASYYENAVEYYRSKYDNAVFVIATDDREWCTYHFRKLDYEYIYLTPNGSSPHEDMAILSICDHSVMSVGTFGWWGAYLAGGDVVFYKDMVTTDGKTSTRANKFLLAQKTEPFWPKRWIGMRD